MARKFYVEISLRVKDKLRNYYVLIHINRVCVYQSILAIISLVRSYIDPQQADQGWVFDELVSREMYGL